MQKYASYPFIILHICMLYHLKQYSILTLTSLLYLASGDFQFHLDQSYLGDLPVNQTVFRKEAALVLTPDEVETVVRSTS